MNSNSASDPHTLANDSTPLKNRLWAISQDFRLNFFLLLFL